MKEISQEEFDQWNQKCKEAETSMENRQERLDELYEEMEVNMTLLGKDK
jgi:hypothetical protein